MRFERASSSLLTLGFLQATVAKKSVAAKKVRSSLVPPRPSKLSLFFALSRRPSSPRQRPLRSPSPSLPRRFVLAPFRLLEHDPDQVLSPGTREARSEEGRREEGRGQEGSRCEEGSRREARCEEGGGRKARCEEGGGCKAQGQEGLIRVSLRRCCFSIVCSLTLERAGSEADGGVRAAHFPFAFPSPPSPFFRPPFCFDFHLLSFIHFGNLNAAQLQVHERRERAKQVCGLADPDYDDSR